MDELERRLTNALHAEADTVELHDVGWNGRPAAAGRGWSTWLAVAAVVTALMVGATFALTGHGGAPDAAQPPVQTTDSTGSPATVTAARRACDGGWTASRTTVITGATSSAVRGIVAVLRFAGGPPGPRTLCALVSSSGGTTLASGSADLDGSKLGYLTVITGQQTFFVGAFSGTGTTLTFAPVQAPTSRGESGSVTVTASTAGVIDLGDGWHGYAVQAPETTSAAVEVTATSTDGAVVGRQHLDLPAAPTLSSARSSVDSATPPVATTRSATGTTTQPPSGALSSALRCGGQLAPPLPGISATVIPQPNGSWQFRLINHTKERFTVDPLHGYAQVLTDAHGMVTSVSQDPSYVLRTPITLNAGASTVLRVVGVSTALCAGGAVPAGDHPMHLVITGQLNGRSVVFTAASFVLHFQHAGPPTLTK